LIDDANNHHAGHHASLDGFVAVHLYYHDDYYLYPNAYPVCYQGDLAGYPNQIYLNPLHDFCQNPSLNWVDYHHPNPY